MNLARIAENLGVSILGHFDGKLEALCPVSTIDGQPAIEERRTGLQTLEAGSLNRMAELNLSESTFETAETPLLVVSALRADMHRPVEQTQGCCLKTINSVADQTSLQLANGLGSGSRPSNVVGPTNFSLLASAWTVTRQSGCYMDAACRDQYGRQQILSNGGQSRPWDGGSLNKAENERARIQNVQSARQGNRGFSGAL